LQETIEEGARERVNGLVTDEDKTQLHARPVVVTSLWPAEAIVAYAKSHAIDVIVIGTHGRRGVEHLLMGSVAERVVRTAPCPVLTVRHPEHEFLQPDALVATAKA
jgi:nucleotide-binding universal stress UspA family protein